MDTKLDRKTFLRFLDRLDKDNKIVIQEVTVPVYRKRAKLTETETISVVILVPTSVDDIVEDEVLLERFVLRREKESGKKKDDNDDEEPPPLDDESDDQLPSSPKKKNRTSKKRKIDDVEVEEQMDEVKVEVAPKERLEYYFFL